MLGIFLFMGKVRVLAGCCESPDDLQGNCRGEEAAVILTLTWVFEFVCMVSEIPKAALHFWHLMVFVGALVRFLLL